MNRKSAHRREATRGRYGAHELPGKRRMLRKIAQAKGIQTARPAKPPKGIVGWVTWS